MSSEAKEMSGSAHYAMKNYSGAIALFRAAIQIDGGNPALYKRLGYALYSAGDQSAAAEAFKKYLELSPDASDRAQIEPYL